MGVDVPERLQTLCITQVADDLWNLYLTRLGLFDPKVVTRMKAIHYDTEGDILSITFSEANGHGHTGVELSDNIVLYLQYLRQVK